MYGLSPLIRAKTVRGHSYPRRLRGRPFRIAATSLQRSCVTCRSDWPLGKYGRRRSPLKFSFDPRCSGLFVSVKYTSHLSIFSIVLWCPNSKPLSNVMVRTGSPLSARITTCATYSGYRLVIFQMIPKPLARSTNVRRACRESSFDPCTRSPSQSPTRQRFSTMRGLSLMCLLSACHASRRLPYGIRGFPWKRSHSLRLCHFRWTQSYMV